jgi:outer membrane cobalamin receptor
LAREGAEPNTTIRKPGYLAAGTSFRTARDHAERSPVRTHSVRLLFLTFTLAFSIAAAASAGPLTGRIVYPDNTAAPGVTVFLRQGPNILASAVAGTDGTFVLTAPDQGQFELQVANPSFTLKPLPLTGQAAARDVGTLTLTVSGPSESVLVSTAAAPITFSSTVSSVTVIRGEELREWQTESIQDALRSVPGVSLASSGGRGAITGLFARGGEADYSLVLVDGVPANAFGGSYDFAHLPAVNVDQIEIVRGPQSALYGANAIGAVISVTSAQRTAPQVSGSFEGGSFDMVRMSAATSGGVGDWRWGAGAERLTTDGMDGELTDAGETVANDDYSRHMFSAGGGWARASGPSIRGNVRYSTDERGFPGPYGSNPAGLFGGIDTISRGTNDDWLASVSATTPYYQRGRALGQFTHGRIDSEFESPFGSSDSFSRRTTGLFQGDLLLTDAVATSAGFEIQRESGGSTFITETGATEVPVERTLTGFFVEGRALLPWPLTLTAGLRVERISRDALPGDQDAFAPRPDFAEETIVSVNPKIAAAWSFHRGHGESTKIRASAGTGIRPPDAFDIAFTDNPDLKPERSRSVDVGVDYMMFTGYLVLESTAFFNTYDDLIVAVGPFNGSSQFRTDNISNARSRGLEIAGTVRTWINPASTWLRARVGYTLLDTEILAVDRDTSAPPPFTPGDALLRRPKHQFSIDLTLTAGRLSGFVHGGGRTSVRDVEPSLGTFGGIFDSAGYSVWNAGATWKVIRTVSIFGRVNNLFNRDYEEVLGFPALPRGVFAGVRVAAGN